MNKQYWKTIFETYVVEDLFFNIYLGRKLNFKKKDDSYIKNYLDKNQLNKKINLNIRRRDFYEFIHKKKF